MPAEGLKPPGDRPTVAELCNQFLHTKKGLIDTCNLTVRTWRDYYGTCESIVAEYGRGRAVEYLQSKDFRSLRQALAKRIGPVRLGNEIQRVRTVFKWAFDSELIERPVRGGPDLGFLTPSRTEQLSNRLPATIVGGVERTLFDFKHGLRIDAHRRENRRMQIGDRHRLFNSHKRPLRG